MRGGWITKLVLARGGMTHAASVRSAFWALLPRHELESSFDGGQVFKIPVVV